MCICAANNVLAAQREPDRLYAIGAALASSAYFVWFPLMLYASNRTQGWGAYAAEGVWVAALAPFVALLPRKGRIIQWWTLLVSIVTFLLTLHLPAHFVYGQTGFQFEENFAWIASPAIRYHLGIDGISLWLVALTAFTTVA